MQSDSQHDRYLAIELQRAIRRREEGGQIDLGTNFLKALARITVRLNRAAPGVVANALDAEEAQLARRAFAYLAAWNANFGDSLSGSQDDRASQAGSPPTCHEPR